MGSLQINLINFQITADYAESISSTANSVDVCRRVGIISNLLPKFFDMHFNHSVDHKLTG